MDFYAQQDGSGKLVDTWSLLPNSGTDGVGGVLPLFRSAVFHSDDGNRINYLTNGAYVVPEPGAMQLFLLGIVGVFSLTALRRNLR